jgi:hypothetical protein
MASRDYATNQAYYVSQYSAPYIAVADGSIGIGNTFHGQVTIEPKVNNTYAKYTLSNSFGWPLIDSNGSIAKALAGWSEGTPFSAKMLCAATEKVMSRNSQISAVDNAAVTLDNQIKHYTIRVTHMKRSGKLPVAITVPAGIPDDAIITFELLIDCSDPSYGSLVTGVEFTVNDSAITPYWIDNFDGVFQEASAPYKLIALRRSFRYNSTAALPGYEPQWIANIESEYNTTE